MGLSVRLHRVSDLRENPRTVCFSLLVAQFNPGTICKGPVQSVYLSDLEGHRDDGPGM